MTSSQEDHLQSTPTHQSGGLKAAANHIIRGWCRNGGVHWVLRKSGDGRGVYLEPRGWEGLSQNVTLELSLQRRADITQATEGERVFLAEKRTEWRI